MATGAGLGPNDPNSNRRLAGQPRAPIGAASIGGLSFSKKDVDTSGLDDVKTKIQAIVGVFATLDKTITGLTTKLDRMAMSMNKATGGGAAGGMAGGGGGGSLTTAGFSGAGAGGGRPRTTSGAPVSAFGGGGRGVPGGATIPLLAGAEVGASWAGGINRAMVGVQGGAGAIDVLGRQASTIFGGSTASNVGSYGFSSQNLMDRAQALSAITSNPMLMPALRGGTQQNKGLFGRNGFVNTLQGLSPGLSAAGAAGLANQLTQGPALQAFQRFGARNGQVGQGLVNPRTMGVNSSSRVFSEMLQTLMGGRQLSSQQMRQLGGNSAQSSRDWTMMTQNAASLGIPSQMLPLLRQYASTGGNLGAAEKNMSNSPVAAQLGAATAKTNFQQTGYEKTVGEQDIASKASRDFYNMLTRLTADSGPLPDLIAGAASAAKFLLSIGAHGAEASVLYTAGKSLLGKGKGGLSGLMPGGGGGGTPAAPTGNNQAPFYIRTDPAYPVVVSLSDETLEKLCGCMGSKGTSGHHTTAKSTPSSVLSKAQAKLHGGGNLGDVVGIGGAILNWLRKVNKNEPWGSGGGADGPPEVPEVPIGDPITGSTTTKGLNPNLSGRVSAMMAANPNLKISSGHRTSAQQKALYGLKGGRGVAKPGNSQHERGNAVDMGPPSQFGWIARNAGKFGLGRPAPGQEPWHLQTMGDPVSGAGSVSGSQVVKAADKWLGTSYQWGGMGTEPGQGVDCSRFVQEVFASLGILLPRTTYQQCAMGTTVNGVGSAQPGDLIFYDYEGPNSHVAIYVGQSKQIAAPETGQKVQIQNVDSGHITQIKRIVGGGAGKAVAQAASQAAGASGTGFSPTPGTNVGLGNNFIAQVGALGGMFGIGGLGSGHATSSSGSGSTTTPASSSSSAAAAPTSAGMMTASQIYDLAKGAGLSAAAARTATAVAKVESGFNPQATDHDSNGTTDYGLWQINSINGGGAGLYNPQAAAAKMAAMTNKGSSWGDWGPDFGESGYGANPPASGLPGSKVAAALASLGTLGDPTTTSFMGAGAATGGSAAVSVGGGSSGRGVTIHMPVQVVGVSQADANMLVQMVVAGIKQADGLSMVSES